MSEVVLSWHPEKFMGQLNVAISDGLNAAAQVLQTEMKRNFVVRNAPDFGTWAGGKFAVGTAGRGNKGTRPSGRGKGGYVSAPFANPTYQSGMLSRSIQIKRARPSLLSAIVGTALPYGAYLNWGTRKMAPRPWLSNAADFAKPKMQAAFLQTARSTTRMVAA